MTFPIPVLVDVLSARYTATGAIDLEITVTNHVGNPEPETIWYTRDVNEEWLSDGRFYELGVDIDAWLFAHPEFEIAAYVAPPPVPEPTIAEKLAAAGIPLDELKAALGL